MRAVARGLVIGLGVVLVATPRWAEAGSTGIDWSVLRSDEAPEKSEEPRTKTPPRGAPSAVRRLPVPASSLVSPSGDAPAKLAFPGVGKLAGHAALENLPELGPIRETWVGFWSHDEQAGSQTTGVRIVNPGPGPVQVQCFFLDQRGSFLRHGLAYVIQTRTIGSGEEATCVAQGTFPPPCGPDVKMVVLGQDDGIPDTLSDVKGWMVITSNGAVLPAPFVHAPEESRSHTPATPLRRVSCDEPAGFEFVCGIGGAE